MEKRLYRSKKERILLGVCGGIAEYFNVDPTLVRIIFISLIFVSGPLLPIFYFISALIIPENPNEEGSEKKTEDVMGEKRNKAYEFWGWFLVIIGVLLLFRSLGWLFIPFRVILAVFLLILGIVLLIKK